MKSLHKFGLMAASALALFAAAQGASAQSGYYDNGYRSDGYVINRYNDNGYYDRARYDGSRRVRCQSRDQRTMYCRIGYIVGPVRLINQLSSRACVRGRTWGVSGDRIWVSRGCRGDFAISSSRYGDDRYARDGRYGDDYYGDRYGNRAYGGYGGYGGSALVVRCESRDGRYNFCRGPGYVSQVQIRRQFSDARCVINSSWGYRNDGIWVDRGCRAEFIVY
jgi:hypothetical protein